jgi:hypothetical protein
MHFLFSIRANCTVALTVLGVVETTKPDKENKTKGYIPLTPELNPSAQRCLTRFLLGILLLEPCISLIYAWKTNKYTNY